MIKNPQENLHQTFSQWSDSGPKNAKEACCKKEGSFQVLSFDDEVWMGQFLLRQLDKRGLSVR